MFGIGMAKVLGKIVCRDQNGDSVWSKEEYKYSNLRILPRSDKSVAALTWRTRNQFAYDVFGWGQQGELCTVHCVPFIDQSLCLQG